MKEAYLLAFIAGKPLLLRYTFRKQGYIALDYQPYGVEAMNRDTMVSAKVKDHISIDLLLKMADGHQLYKVSSQRLHEITAEVVNAMEKQSELFHGADSVANQEQRDGKKPGQNARDRQRQNQKRPSKSNNKDGQKNGGSGGTGKGSQSDAFEKLKATLAKYVTKDVLKEQEKKEKEIRISKNILLKSKVHSNALHTGTSSIKPETAKLAKAVRILAKFWGLGKPIPKGKFNPVLYTKLVRTDRNPLPAVDSSSRNKNARILITNDESGSCLSFSGNTRLIAEELVKLAGNSVDVHYAPNANGILFDEESDTGLWNKSVDIMKSIDYVLYIGDGDGLSFLDENKISPKTKWIYLDTYAHNTGRPRLKRLTIHGRTVFHIDRVDVASIDSICDGLMLLQKAL
jgi:hypothetical protein